MASDWIRGNRNEKTVILDSNAVMMLFEFQINLEDELVKLIGKNKIIIPKTIINELDFLSKNGKGKKRINAKASLELIKKYEIVDIDIKNADDSIYQLAKQTCSYVLTNDKELRQRLKKISIPVIFLRAKKKLQVG